MINCITINNVWHIIILLKYLKHIPIKYIIMHKTLYDQNKKGLKIPGNSIHINALKIKYFQPLTMQLMC